MLSRTYARAGAALIAILAIGGCDGFNPVGGGGGGGQVVLRAANTPLAGGSVYDESGREVARLSGTGELSAQLPAGTYYLDLVDDLGNSAFSQEVNLRFAPAAEGAALDVSPHRVPGLNRPVLGITIGQPAGPVRNHTMGSEASSRARVVWEAARAQVGPGGASAYQWNTTTNVNSTFNYALEDPGAWAALRTSYGSNLSCRNDNDRTNNSSPCSLTYGADNLAQYSCQGGSPCVFRAGQCKAAMNLVLYRSGVYHRTNWGFRVLPSDASTPSVAKKLTSATLQVGDVLRKVSPSPHAMIVVRVLSPTKAVVFDSNWVGGAGQERMGTHVVSIQTAGNLNGTVSDLDTYYDLDCVYKTNGQC
jgi:hypothetical protein